MRKQPHRPARASTCPRRLLRNIRFWRHHFLTEGERATQPVLRGPPNAGASGPVVSPACRLFAEELRDFQGARRWEGGEIRPAEAIAEEAIAEEVVAEEPTAEEPTAGETATTTAVVQAPAITCASCQERVPSNEALRAPCSHNYCTGCLEQLHRTCMTDESLYPPASFAKTSGA